MRADHALNLEAIDGYARWLHANGDNHPALPRPLANAAGALVGSCRGH